MKSIFPAFFLIVLASGCSRNGTEMAVDGDIFGDLPAEYRKAYANLKKIPESAVDRRDRMYLRFTQESIVADYLMADSSNLTTETQVAILEARNKIVIDQYLQHKLNETVTEAVIQKYYEENKNDFVTKEVYIAHILIRPTPRMDEQHLQEQALKVNEIMASLKDGVDFSVMAREHSDDTGTKNNGGEIGWLNSETGDPSLVETASNLRPGEFSEPIQTRRGLQIIQLIEAPVINLQPFDQIRDKIRYQLRANAKKQEWERVVAASNLARGV